MSLVSFSYLFLFLPAVLLVYYLVPRRHLAARNAVLLVFSLGFVFYAEPGSLFTLVFEIVLLYFLGKGIEKSENPRTRKTLFAAGIVLTVGLLCYFKYTAFAVQNWNALFGTSFSWKALASPVGVSFFTFLAVSYLADVYHGRCAAEKNPAALALYISFFPKYTQGPLTRYGAVAPELTARRESWDDAAAGAERIVIGLGKKLLIANACASVANEIFALSAGALTPAKAWIGAFCYAWQIYFDFAGYTDMAIGAGLLFGFHLPENFRDPYMAVSATDFWRRWHITLSQWFRDYVYIPLGGNRRGRARQLLNILIVWLLTGLWHGASWNFLLWGLWFALLLAMEKLWLGKLLERAPRAVGHLYAVFIILLGWVIFRSPDVQTIGTYAAALFGGTAARADDAGYLWLTLRQYGAPLLFAALLSTPLGKTALAALEKTKPGRAVRLVLLLLVLALSLLTLANTSMNAFIYAQF
jgi:alginate O-acetyltransferase complex protein AlgI